MLYIYQSGGSQAIRIPKEFRISSAKNVILIKKFGEVLIIIPENHSLWKDFFKKEENEISN